MPAGAGELDEREAERLCQAIWKGLSWVRVGACQSGEFAHSYSRPSVVHLFVLFSFVYSISRNLYAEGTIRHLQSSIFFFFRRVQTRPTSQNETRAIYILFFLDSICMSRLDMKVTIIIILSSPLLISRKAPVPSQELLSLESALQESSSHLIGLIVKQR